MLTSAAIGMKSTAQGLLSVLALSLALGAGCDKDKDSANPDDGSNLLGVGGSGNDEDLEGGMFGEEEGFDLEEDAEWEPEPRPKLDKRKKAVEKCKTTGKGKDRAKECRMVDPKPALSAAYGVYALMEDMRWGMTPSQVYTVLARDIEAEYAKRQEAAAGATEQDVNTRWRQEQLASLKADHTKFTKASRHRWGVSLIQFEYEDDNNEEMLFVRTGTGLRKFYFFKDDELWKIFYAYGTDVWPGKSYEDIVTEKFMEWFGPTPEQKVKQDPETAEPLVRYNEWTSQDGDIVRSFDLTQVHGAIGLTVLDGNAEQSIGERLPTGRVEGDLTDTVGDVIGGTDVCYTDDGEIVECSEEEAMGLDEE